MKFPIYLDYHSTTPVDPKVLDGMMPYLTSDFGNASSKSHCFGWKAEFAVEKGRERAFGLPFQGNRVHQRRHRKQ